MADDAPDDPFDAYVARFVEALLRDGVAGGTISRDGMTLGIPNWEERTKDQRYIDKAKTHGYPHGLAKSARFLRNQRVAELRDRVLSVSEHEREVYAAAFEALAYAIDAERFCGSFSMRGHNTFSAEAVDTIAENIIVWLAERGHQVTACPSVESESPLSTTVAGEPVDDGAIAGLSEIPWDLWKAREDAATRIEQRYTHWSGKRYSRRKREGGYYNFLYVPAKLRRQGVIERYREKLVSLEGEDRTVYREAHEALAYAFDAELFLQSVPGNDLEGDALEDAVNRFTNRLLAWLDSMGYQLVPRAAETPGD